MTTKANKTVIGIDCSTHSVAYAVFKNDTLKEYGEIDFVGNNVFMRARDAKKKTEALSKKFKSASVAIEKTIMVRSVQTAIYMAFVAGNVITSLTDDDSEFYEIPPISWQCFIGNPVLKANEKELVKKQFPGKSKTWYSSKHREIRKQRTIDWCKKKFGVTIKSDNVSDAIGLGYYAYERLVK